MIYYFDSSALVKRYVVEIGTTWVKNILTAALPDEVIISKITGAEVASAFARRHRAGDISTADYTQALNDFYEHFHYDYIRIEVTDSVVLLAMDIAQQHALRGYDTIQLASALLMDAELKQAGEAGLTFVSADNNLCDAARLEGLITENPNNYP